MQIAKNKVVSIEYTLTDSAGSVLDSSSGQAPLAYLHGSGNIIPGLENALEGKSAGDSLKVVVPPEQAYGIHDAKLVQDVPRTAFGKTDVKPGMQFRAEGPNAGSRLIKIVSVKQDTIQIDANHPLAGQTLNFDVKVVSIRDASQEELDHGHVHGAGGHHH